MDGERDPVNLMNYFKIFPLLSEIVPNIVKDNSEELFDIISQRKLGKKFIVSTETGR